VRAFGLVQDACRVTLSKHLDPKALAACTSHEPAEQLGQGCCDRRTSLCFVVSDEFATIFHLGLDPENRKVAIEMVIRIAARAWQHPPAARAPALPPTGNPRNYSV
jgi:hypothetical protein